ncbi:hypothetical protein BDQ12DRAFT_729050 [Crucibulum laeve]|uniref:Pheromone n=1 Tax=Crucibulum laeve TaxID=68775 RepID=A0A5C3LFR7_9AGAR|nr:hypothetical protein BDQ12DRAFT_729050 [Crucibulum laeve]
MCPTSILSPSFSYPTSTLSHLRPSSREMDSFSTIISFFSAPSQAEDVALPADEEKSGSGQTGYCVVA